jgi:hypothetical protein
MTERKILFSSIKIEMVGVRFPIYAQQICHKSNEEKFEKLP